MTQPLATRRRLKPQTESVSVHCFAWESNWCVTGQAGDAVEVLVEAREVGQAV
jgi:hypothetical protein